MERRRELSERQLSSQSDFENAQRVYQRLTERPAYAKHAYVNPPNLEVKTMSPPCRHRTSMLTFRNTCSLPILQEGC